MRWVNVKTNKMRQKTRMILKDQRGILSWEIDKRNLIQIYLKFLKKKSKTWTRTNILKHKFKKYSEIRKNNNLYKETLEESTGTKESGNEQE